MKAETQCCKNQIPTYLYHIWKMLLQSPLSLFLFLVILIFSLHNSTASCLSSSHLPNMPKLFSISKNRALGEKVKRMEQGAVRRDNTRFSSHDKRLLAIGLAILAIVSPLYVNHGSTPEAEIEEEPVNFSAYLPLLQLLLIMAIAVSGFMERGFTGLDPYWIHRAGGSSTGIVVILIILTFVLKWKAN